MPPWLLTVFRRIWLGFLFDLDASFVFLFHIAITARRPDGVFYSDYLQRVIFLELTVPIEDRILTTWDIETRRYDSLVSERISNRWKTTLLTDWNGM